ncbi:phBC6A51 family helix-turn-helix protein [Halobacillus naozhouensis]|uniref:PhBC6A51 family helix-turn-helix protein n=1 Tax=Halobacillus naozhouensis TaxID=554880 RepID=A0ABY8IXU2_9BACI|nr:phBC6A51 family helix-turn-helix protein [Halobacillus naozhouensis]WFT74875.1 phBC6A51 family helix-turn-helix protein [Halobacillus naozhouensis]
MPRKKKRSKQPSQVPSLSDEHYLAMYLSTRPIAGHWLNREEIAEQVGVCRMTLYRWEQRKDYQREKDKVMRKYLREKFPKGETLATMAIAGDVDSAIKLLQAGDFIV